MKLNSGHLEVIQVFKKCKLREKEAHIYEITAPGIFDKIEKLQVELALLGYSYLEYEFKHHRLPKIVMVPEPEILFVLSK
jgi:hypothetical protein